MGEPAFDKRNYDIASISRGEKKPTYQVQEANTMDPSKVQKPGKFIKVFADVFLRREASDNWIF
ncbi:MAG: hypothetical protein QME05_02955 [Candidatus Margulisbacteria bacterium]|nr:hypothetical protein [Candidatus Margulisiibacteriota bacterium]